MPRIAPFVALLFDPAVAGSLDRVTAPPYDVIGEEARRQYLAMSPYNIVHLELGEERGPDGGGYEAVGKLLSRWRAEGALRPTSEPVYLAYEMRFRLESRDRRIRGVMVALELEEPGGSVLPHERTMPGPVEDRLRLMRAADANLSPVYGTFTGPVEPLTGLLDEVTGGEPVAATDDEEGVTHRLWQFEGDTPLQNWIGDRPVLIADGHHRYTTALRFRDEMRRRKGPGPWDRVLALLVDSAVDELPVLPFHRLVLSGPVPSEGERVRDLQEVLVELDDANLVYGTAAREEGAVVHRVARLEGEPPTVRALHERKLDGSVPLEALRFVHDASEAEAAVRTGTAVAAYFLPPTTTDRIRAAIAAGGTLPQKSTFFWPKPRTGMVLRAWDGSG